VADYRKIGKKKRSIGSREELNKFNLGKKVQNINRITYNVFYECQLIEFLISCLALILKEDGRGRLPEMEGSIHLTQTTKYVRPKPCS
jgi:hypothetical protein